ncbi:MAG: gamma-glutamyltransferase, partial [Chloroflexi bacterium]
YRHAPIRLDYRGHTILMPPPPSTGGALIAFSLKLLESLDLSDVDHASTRHLTILAEVMRLTKRARQRWEALSQLEGAERVAAFLDDTMVASYREALAEALARPAPRSDGPGGGGPANTTHISVVDRDGLVVSLTTTPGESAGFIVGDTGVTLNNLMGEADLHPRGFHQDPPGIRLASMMAPTIVLKEGRPVLALGSGGSNRLRTAIFQVLNNLLDFPLSLERAVLAPRVHFEEGILHLEGGYNPQVADELEALGYRVNRWRQRNLYFGGVHAVAWRGDTIEATGDPRRGGAVAIL